MTKVSELKPGDRFKKRSQRDWREIKNIHELGDGPNIPHHHKNKRLVVLTNCKQIIMAPDEEVNLKPDTDE